VEKHGAKVTSLKIPATVIVNKLKKYVDSAVEKMVYKNADAFKKNYFRQPQQLKVLQKKNKWSRSTYRLSNKKMLSGPS
jgi:hypothetical protein